MIAPCSVLLLPGLYDSGPDHWQSHWEREDRRCQRVTQRDWVTPDRAEWVETLHAAVQQAAEPIILVGHSTGCLLAVHWAASAAVAHLGRVRGALLVAPSDPDRPSYPVGPTGWSPVPLARLPFQSVVVASRDDEYVTLDRARQFAEAWGSRFVDAGSLGHINSASGLGRWASGRSLLTELCGTLKSGSG